MIRPNQIPPVVAATLRGAPANFTTEQALAAALAAWPGATYAKWEAYGQRDRLVLPVSSVAFGELTELGIEEARRAAGAPAEDDPEWKVVESAFPPTAKTEDGA